MPAIDFCYSGWVRGLNITTVVVAKTGMLLNVSRRKAEVVVANLEAGVWLLPNLGDALAEARKADLDVFDVEVSED